MDYEERGAGALPMLYGAPAYHRRQAPVVARTQRPFDPDDLPLESLCSDVVGAGIAPDSTPGSTAWADMVGVIGPSATDAQYHARPVAGASVAGASVAGASVAVADPPSVEAQPNLAGSPAHTYPAAPIATEEPAVPSRIGGLFKGRGRGAS